MRLIILASLVGYAKAQHFICYPLTGYDTSHLTDVTQWKIQTDSHCLSHPAVDCSIYVSFCQLAPNCFNQYAACEQSELSNNVTIIGEHTSTPFHAYESGGASFYAEFPMGPLQNISNSTYCSPSLRIEFECDEDYQWQKPIIYNATANAPLPEDIDFDPNDACRTIIRMKYSGACKPKPQEGGITAGGVFLIILFVTTLVYFIFGALYNGCIKHRSGIHLIPQAQFWIGLPLYMIEGCRATITCCTRTQPSSSSNYDSV